jgi:hypothetical protein
MIYKITEKFYNYEYLKLFKKIIILSDKKIISSKVEKGIS